MPVPTAADLAPAAIAVAERRRSTVSDLVLKRDIYYTQYPGRIDYGHGLGRPLSRGRPSSCSTSCPTPRSFASLANVRSHEYEIGEDRFMMLGDNSPRSKDSRGWDSSDSGVGPVRTASPGRFPAAC